jgi:ABC-type amino acid transport substrate-binding protein
MMRRVQTYSTVRHAVNQDSTSQPVTGPGVGVGVRHGQPALLHIANKILLGMEKNGEARQICDAWLGSGSRTPQPRQFKIVSD